MKPEFGAGTEDGDSRAAVPSPVRLFHQVNHLIPNDQVVQSVPPNMHVADALNLMEKSSFSQLPVVEGGEVLGFFSYRSLALFALRGGAPACDLDKAQVADFLEEPRYVASSTELTELTEVLDHSDAVLVGQENAVQAIVTPIDALRYLTDIAEAFVLLEEIELALRALISMSVDNHVLEECIDRSLAYYDDDTRPRSVDDFTFEDHVSILRDGRNWPLFEPVFGGTRATLRSRLEPIRTIRNNVFHFRRPGIGVTTEEHEKLVWTRNWLLTRARIYEARQKKGDK